MSLITAEELAPQLRLSVGQVYRLAREKQIPSHRLGNAVRFNLEAVLAATIEERKPLRVLSPAARLPRNAECVTIRKVSNLSKIDWRTA